VNLLLDTRVLLWCLLDPSRLGAAATSELQNPANTLFASAVSAWEIAIKQSLGKLTLPGPADVWLPLACLATDIGWLPVTAVDAAAVGRLPWHHRDPFDRLLVAQVRGGLTLVTHDRAVAPYGIPILWA
jgi:PIN domain nuclease of toxin-antitoxin system